MPKKAAAAVCRFFVTLMVACVFFNTLAIADTMTLNAVAFGTAKDGGTAAEPVADGQFDSLLPGDTLYVYTHETVGTTPEEYTRAEYRSLYEFSLPAELLQPGVIVHQATLVVPVITETWLHPADHMPLYGYTADSTVTVDDFGSTNVVKYVQLSSGVSESYRYIDLTSYLQSFPGSGIDRIGLVAAVGSGLHLEWTSGATLQIEYSPPSSTEPGLSVVSPLPDASYWSDEPIYLHASASDAQDGNLDAAISWTSWTLNQSTSLGTGSHLTVQLPAGQHEITASVTDTDGNAAAVYRYVTVVAAPPHNEPPTVTILSPADGAELIGGEPVTLQAVASDLEDGDVGQSITWLLDDGQTELGTGASVTTTLPVGAHMIGAIAADSAWRHAVAVVNVNVVSPLAHCTARGANASREWIRSVFVNGAGMTSASNGGYADFTGTQIQAAKGANTIALTPRFMSGTTRREYWTVWVDLNRDRVFDPQEMLASANGNSTITTTLTIPADVAPGPARMRVAMRYDQPPAACGTFQFGEVEDYTVLIP